MGVDTAALLTYLRTLGPELTLRADDQALPAPLREVLSSVPDQRLTLTPGADGLHLDGTVLTISGATTAPWPVTNLGRAVITPQAAELRCTADDQVTGTITGHLPLSGSVQAPVKVTSVPPVPSVDGEPARAWRVSLTGDVTGVTPLDLVLLGQSPADLAIVEPAGLPALGRRLTVPASGFEVTFYPGTAFDAVLGFEVDVPDLAWSPVVGLMTVDQVGLAATVGSDAWSLAVIGRFSIGGVPMQLSVGLGDDAVLVATLVPVGAAAFPGLAALAAWVAGVDPGASADPGVSAIGGSASEVDAAIASVAVRFDARTAKLLRLDVVSVLTLGALRLDIAYRFPDGSIAGSLHDGKPVPLSGVLASLGLPTDLPGGAGGQITAAGFSANPSKGAYLADLSVDTGITAGPLKIERVFFSVERSVIEGVTGQLGGTITFASGAAIDVLAQYGGAAAGWEFAGRTEPGTVLQIGEVLADLAGAFGAMAVPEPVKQLVLTDVAVDYRSGTGAFTFTCGGGLTIADTPVAASIVIDVKPQAGGGYEKVFSGHLMIGDLRFDVTFDSADAGAQMFVAEYSHTGDDQTVSLHDLVAHVSAAAARLVPSGLDIGLRDARLLYVKQATGPSVFALGLVLSAAVDLSQLPLVGDRLPADETLAVDALQIMYASGALTAEQLQTLGRLLPPAATPLPAGPLASGVTITARLQAGGQQQNTALALAPEAAPSPASAGAPPAKAAPAGYWLDVHRQLGVVQINRVGLLYQGGALLVGLDAAIALGPLSMSLDGLCFGSSLTRFEPRFGLSGLGLAYSSGGLTISGALLRVPADQLAADVAFQFDGTVQISARALQIAGLGSYAQFADGSPSLFVFAQLQAPLGGPPAFFVDGLMGGFGFNRSLTLPGPDEVTAFPLIALGTPPAPGQPAAAQDPARLLAVLEGAEPITPGGAVRHWIAPVPGAMWLAFGVAFTSFELVHTKALLVADISEHFKIAVLGSSILRLPQASDSPRSYAYVELGIEAVLDPGEGYFALTAILSRNSYVISPDCHLTGGFAVATWFGSNPHAGQFVLTLGGYHPAFPVPGHFPVVPRLGFRWTVSDTVTISGSAYAALTTSCVMAGGRLEAVFADGGLRAWFTVEADLLISWRPFFFTGHFALSIGVSYSFSVLGIHKTLSVSVGAGLDLWGPPTGGTVSVSLWVVSFTVAFGASRNAAADAALSWPQFRELLPAPDAAVVIQSAGEIQNTLPGAGGAKVWVVRATGFSFRTQSALPASDLRYGPAAAQPALRAAATPATPAAPAAPTPTTSGLRAAAATPASSPHDHSTEAIDIKPMNLTGVASVHRLTVRFGSPTAAPLDITGWTLTPRTAAVPDSLWGKPPENFTQIPARPAADILPGRYVGYDVRTPPPALGTTRGTVPAAALTDDVVARADLPVSPGTPAGTIRPVPDANCVAAIAGIAAAAGARQQLYAQLSAATGFAGPNGPLDRLAASAGELYSDSPMREG